MKTNFKKGMVVIVSTIIAALSAQTVQAAPNYIINTPMYKVIDAHNFYEYAPPNDKTKYGWCGHTAVQIVLDAFGVKNAKRQTVTLQDIHDNFIAVNAKSNNAWNYQRYQSECSAGWCPEVNLMRKAITTYRGANGVMLTERRFDLNNPSDFAMWIRWAISSNKLIIMRSRTYWSYGRNM